MKVCKFGGTSMADAAAITKVVDIVTADPERKFVVVSAPGKRFKDDIKITDRLYAAADAVEQGRTCDEVFASIAERFDGIVRDLGLDLDLTPYYEEIVRNVNAGANRAYCASRGEYLSAIVFAAKLGWEFVDAAEIVKFFENGSFDSEYTNDLATLRFKRCTRAVIPGFYGAIEGNRIQTFSRGGSDITGSIVARAVHADVYENWTDVDGFLMCDPRVVENPAQIQTLTYKELHELSYMGASVLHPDAVFPVQVENIPINIRNTFRPEHPGTMIIPTERRGQSRYPITGVVGKHNFVAIHIEKSKMNSECGFIRRALTVLEHYNINVEHIPSGIDTMTLVLDETQFDEMLERRIVSELKSTLATDDVTVERGLSCVATVGHGMAHRLGTAATLTDALCKAGVNIIMIDQGSSEMNIIVAVHTEDCDKAINAIYRAFVA